MSLNSNSHTMHYDDYMETEQMNRMIREAMPAYQTGFHYRKQGEYTIEDYYALPEGFRAELIDGVFYYMSSPSWTHQRIISALHYHLETHIRKSGKRCAIFFASLDVRLDRDDKTVVQPDLFILCGDMHTYNDRIDGPPTLVVEVLSPSTRRKDCTLKLQKYRNAGVKEYWIADPMNRTVTVHNFAQSQEPATYSFRDQIPVAIWDGQFSVDFAEIDDDVNRMYDMFPGMKPDSY